MAYEYESKEARTLKAIQSKNYPDTNKDFVKNISRLNSSVDYISSYMNVMQKGIDDANKNIIEQLQGILQDIWVLFAGGEPTGFDIGDVKYIFMALGALFGFSGRPFPYNVIDMVDHMFDNFLSLLPQFTDVIFDTIFAWADALGVDPEFTGILRDAYDNAIDALNKAGNIIEALAGFGGGIGDMLTGIGGYIYDEFIQPIIDFISRAIGGPIGGAFGTILTNIARIFGLASGADTKATQLLKAARPLWETLDGNGETSCALSTSDTLMTINATTSRGGFIRCMGGDIKQTISCIVSKSGTVNTFHLDVYILNATNGIDWIYSSSDQSSLLLGTETVLFHEIPAEQGIASNQNTFYLVVARMTGSGSVSIQGRVFPVATTSSRPLYSGLVRNPTTDPVPANISSGTLDTLYVKETPYFQLGAIDDILPQSFFVDFTTLSDNLWIKRRYFTSGLGDPKYLTVDGSGRLYMPPGGANGYSGIVHKYRVATNRCRVGVRLGSALTSTYTYFSLFAKLDYSSMVSLGLKEDQIVLGKGTSINNPAATIGAGFVAPSGLGINVGDWVWMEYNPDDQSFRVYVNPNFDDPDYWLDALISTTSGFEVGIQMDSTSRSSALIMQQTPGGTRGYQPDDWILEDWAEPV